MINSLSFNWTDSSLTENMFDSEKLRMMNRNTNEWYRSFRYTGSFNNKMYFEVDPWGLDMPAIIVKYDEELKSVLYSFVPKFRLGDYIIKPDLPFERGILHGFIPCERQCDMFYCITKNFISDAKVKKYKSSDLANYEISTNKFIIGREYTDNGVHFMATVSNVSDNDIRKVLYDSIFNVKQYIAKTSNTIMVTMTDKFGPDTDGEVVVYPIPVAKVTQ